MAEYAIQPPSLRCARSGRELKPGDVYYSVLSDSPEGFIRLDYAAEAWDGPPEGAIGFWRASVPAATASRRPQPVDDSVITQFFESLAGEDDPTKRNFRYILGLLLLRRKILKLAGHERDAQRDVLVLRAAATGQEYKVVDPHLTEEQLVAVQAEVGKILQSPMG